MDSGRELDLVGDVMADRRRLQSGPYFRDKLYLAMPGLLGFALRLWSARGSDLGLDGGLSVALALVPIGEELRFLAHDVHPPLYYVLLRPWLNLAGTSPFAVTFLGVVIGTLALTCLVGWTRSIAGVGAALAVGGLGAVAPAWVIIDETTREYGLVILLLTLTAWAYTRWSGGWRVVVLGVAALWVSYLSIVGPIAIGADALVRRDRRRLLLSVLMATGVLPWLAFAFSRGFATTLRSSGPRQSSVPAPPIPSQARELIVLMTGGTDVRLSVIGPGLFALALALLVVLRWRRSVSLTGRARPSRVFLASASLSAVVVALAVNTVWTRQDLGARYLAPIIPFALAGLALGLAPLVRRSRIGVALLIGLMAVPSVSGFWLWNHRAPPPSSFWDAPALVSYLDSRVQLGDSVVFIWPEQAGYYQMLSKNPRRWAILPAGIDYLQGDAAARARLVLPSLARESSVIWLVVYRQMLGSGTTEIIDWLSLNAYAANGASLPDSEVYPFVTGTPSVASERLDAVFQGGIRLLRVAWPAVIHPREAIPIDLSWGGGDTSRNLRVFVHLVDAAGQTVAQHDGIPRNARAPVPAWSPGAVIDDRHGLLAPLNLSPGRYWLEIGLYDDSGRLPLVRGGTFVRLGPLQAS